ncbi:hypothetical protein B0T14DRAFT_526689 [Immersiella caudata]|uniref:Uncharacterized protein n=1 Tax=Immersiella caudata TaxID=314043 RepID=A0AA39WE16_9PEZI|nr:hypothetical protein B0T14DRAFT_526689 [Immersiella caudata]
MRLKIAHWEPSRVFIRWEPSLVEDTPQEVHATHYSACSDPMLGGVALRSEVGGEQSRIDLSPE